PAPRRVPHLSTSDELAPERPLYEHLAVITLDACRNGVMLTCAGRQVPLAATSEYSLRELALAGNDGAVGMLDAVAARVAAGETVEFRPSGNSMVPLIHSRQLVKVAPVDPTTVEVGDIVLCRVAGSVYLHLVSAINPATRRVQISNNRGRVNGWTGHNRVYGRCVAIDGVARRVPRTAPPDAGSGPRP
ncbi:hypothetical protein, partial [Actinokineospora sp.]|uniref:hypothetical protein n=1 Tax=Actinokineospora sp. TaxID=1872133 RepID=UPI003D6A7066